MEMIFVYGLIVAFILSVWMCLASRLGYNPLLGFLAIIPVVNLFAIGYMAFAESPNEAALRRRAYRMNAEDNYPEFFHD